MKNVIATRAVTLLSGAIVVVTATVAGSAQAEPAAGPRILVVTPSIPAGPGDAAAEIEAGLRDGAAAIPGAVVADAASAAVLVDDAKSTGLECAVADGACWLRVAVLGGLDHVVFVSGTNVTWLSAAGSRTALVLQPTRSTSWAAAVRRTAGLESALSVTVTPPDANVTVDGIVVVGGVVEGLAAGPHAVAAAAPAFMSATTTVTLTAGEMGRANMTLAAEVVPVPPPGPSGLSTALRYGGGGAAVLGVGVGTTAFIVGQASCYDGKSFQCTTTNDGLADTLTLAGIGVIVGVGGVGAAALASSFFIADQ